MFYQKLKLKSFNRKYKRQNITKNNVVFYLRELYSNVAFSTFPYIFKNNTSSKALEYNCGNCVALSIYIKNRLKKELNIDSYLIPATIPKYLQKQGYLDISHIALAIPYDKNHIFIVDPAFYFIEPIDICKKQLPHNNKPILKSKIYNNAVYTIHSSTRKLKQDIVFNKYQTIPANTIVCDCIDEEKQPWSYFLIEALNPDKAISKFFIEVRKYPFITSTEVDSDGVCKPLIDLRIKNNNQINIALRNKNIYTGSINYIPHQIINLLNNLVGKHFDSDITNYL